MSPGFLRGDLVELKGKTIDRGARERRDRPRRTRLEGRRRGRGPFRRPHGLLLARGAVSYLPHLGDDDAARRDLCVDRSESPVEDAWLGKATERIFLPAVKMTLPEIVDYDLPVAGAFHNCVIVSIRKSFPGHAQKVMHALWGLGMLALEVDRRR